MQWRQKSQVFFERASSITSGVVIHRSFSRSNPNHSDYLKDSDTEVSHLNERSESFKSFERLGYSTNNMDKSYEGMHVARNGSLF